MKALLLALSLGFTAVADNNLLEGWEKFLVGCRPSPGECVNSCAYRKAEWQLGAAGCDPESYSERYACWCYVPKRGPRPETPPVRGGHRE